MVDVVKINCRDYCLSDVKKQVIKHVEGRYWSHWAGKIGSSQLQILLEKVHDGVDQHAGGYSQVMGDDGALTWLKIRKFGWTEIDTVAGLPRCTVCTTAEVGGTLGTK